jgi:hypothetical protein
VTAVAPAQLSLEEWAAQVAFPDELLGRRYIALDGGGPGRLLAELVRRGLDRAAVLPAAALVLELERRAARIEEVA